MSGLPSDADEGVIENMRETPTRKADELLMTFKSKALDQAFGSGIIDDGSAEAQKALYDLCVAALPKPVGHADNCERLKGGVCGCGMAEYMHCLDESKEALKEIFGQKEGA